MFHSKLSVELFASISIVFWFWLLLCFFFYDREWWKQILSTTVRSLWQEALILLEAQCVQFNDCIILLCFDTFGCPPTLTQTLGLPGAFNSHHRYNAITSFKNVLHHWEAASSYFWLAENEMLRPHTLKNKNLRSSKLYFSKSVELCLFFPIYLTDAGMKMNEEVWLWKFCQSISFSFFFFFFPPVI